MNISMRLAELRKQKGLSVNKLANLSGISQGFLREVELGQKSISIKSLTYICEALNITLEDFFSSQSTSVFDSELLKAVNKLTPEQKEALIQFINLL